MRSKEKRPRREFSEEFKLSVLQDYYSSGLSMKGCIRKHGLSSTALICNWLKKYESKINALSLSSNQKDGEMANRSKEDYTPIIKHPLPLTHLRR